MQEEKKGYKNSWIDNQVAVFWKYNTKDGKQFYKTKKGNFSVENIEHLINMLQKYKAEKTNLVMWPINVKDNPQAPNMGLYLLEDKE